MLFRYLSDKISSARKASAFRALLLSALIVVCLSVIIIAAIDFINVSTTATIYVTFEDKIDRTSIAGNFFVEDSEGNNIPGVTSLGIDGKKIGFKPGSPLNQGETYKIIIKMGLMTEDGRHLPEERIITFSTKSDDVTPSKPPSGTGGSGGGGSGKPTPTPTPSAVPTAVPSATPENGRVVFKDMDGHWANEYVDYLVSQGVINGYEEGGEFVFKPNNLVTRAEFAKIITTVLEIDTKKSASAVLPFYDADGFPLWANEYIVAAYVNGLILGKTDKNGDLFFDYGANVTRAEIVTIIGRTLNETAATDHTFADSAKILEWSAPYVALAVEKGFLSGYDDNTFRPGNFATRAEVAKIVCNFVKYRNR